MLGQRVRFAAEAGIPGAYDARRWSGALGRLERIARPNTPPGGSMAQQNILPPARAVDRAQQVASVVHSAAMERLHVTAATRAELDRFAEGGLEVEELVRRTRARYGLE